MKPLRLLLILGVEIMISFVSATPSPAMQKPVDEACLAELLDAEFSRLPMDFYLGMVTSCERVPITADNLIQAYLRGLHLYGYIWCALPTHFVMDFTGPRKYQPNHDDLAFLRNAWKKGFSVRRDFAFQQTVEAAANMKRKEGTNWISPNHRKVYQELFDRGFAHSFEVWRDGQLVAGLFGVLVGNVFRIESMFHLTSQDGKPLKIANNAGKLALEDCIKWQIEQGLTFMDTMEGHSNLMNDWGSYPVSRHEFSLRVRAAQDGG